MYYPQVLVRTMVLVIDTTCPMVGPVQIVRDINRKTVAKVTESLQECIAKGQRQLVLDIDSPGGECYAAIAIIELIRACEQVDVVTIVSGFAASAAALIFASGTKGYRYMNPNARLLLHSVQVTAGQMNMAEFHEEYEETRALNEKLCEMASENARSNTSIKDIIESCNVDKYISADECLQAGLCDHLYVPSIHVSTTITLGAPTNARPRSPTPEPVAEDVVTKKRRRKRPSRPSLDLYVRKSKNRRRRQSPSAADRQAPNPRLR